MFSIVTHDRTTHTHTHTHSQTRFKMPSPQARSKARKRGQGLFAKNWRWSLVLNTVGRHKQRLKSKSRMCWITKTFFLNCFSCWNDLFSECNATFPSPTEAHLCSKRTVDPSSDSSVWWLRMLPHVRWKSRGWTLGPFHMSSDCALAALAQKAKPRTMRLTCSDFYVYNQTFMDDMGL